MRLNEIGNIVGETWHQLPNKYPNIKTDEFIIMPNHIHGIVWITDDPVGAQFIAPTFPGVSRFGTMSDSKKGVMSDPKGVMNHARTVGNGVCALGNIVRTLKALSTFRIRKIGYSYFGWQRNYYERIIRSERELDAVRRYIQNNPLKWERDTGNVK